MNLLQTIVFVILLSLVATLAQAGAGYAGHPEARAFMQEMTREYGFDEEHLRRWLEEARHQERIIELISTPAERTLEWHEYRAIFIKPERIAQGVEFMAGHRDAFARAQRQYGVPPEIIAAIIGVETWYGRYRGSYRVLDALATLAFDYPPRNRFFLGELRHFFLMAREQGFAPDSLKGSYAGAMGYGQFIASSYRHYAVDFDGDSVVDIFDNPVDAIGSVANYFAEHRWKSGGPVAFRLADGVEVPQALLSGELKPSLTVSDYRRAGVPVPGHLPGDEPARVIRVEGEGGPQWWLTCHNFYVITRYNHSHLYGLAVTVLADELARAGRSGSGVAGSHEKTDE